VWIRLPFCVVCFCCTDFLLNVILFAMDNDIDSSSSSAAS